MYNRPVNQQFYSHAATAYADSRLLKIHSVTDSEAAAANASHHTLLQLIQQHQHQQGWILLIAPSHIPHKAWAEQHQLSFHNVLVVHQKQIRDLNATIQQALASSSCKVVINFARMLDPQQLDGCRKLAVTHNTWFYQCEQLQQERITH